MTAGWPDRSAKRLRWNKTETAFVRHAARSIHDMTPRAKVMIITRFIKGRSYDAVRSKLGRELVKMRREKR